MYNFGVVLHLCVKETTERRINKIMCMCLTFPYLLTFKDKYSLKGYDWKRVCAAGVENEAFSSISDWTHDWRRSVSPLALENLSQDFFVFPRRAMARTAET